MRRLTLSLCLIFGVTAALASAAERNPQELELTTQRVIIFKDGYSLIIKKGTATSDKEGEVFTDEVPEAAVLGSFWATPEQGRLISMVAGWKATKNSEEKQIPCTQPLEILLANKGKQAKIELHDKTIYNGVIREVLVDRTEAPLAPAQMEFLELAAAKPKAPLPVSSKVSRLRPAETTSEHTLTSVAGSNFVLRTDDGDVLLQVPQIRSIQVKDMNTSLSKTLTTSKRTKRLSFKLEGAEKKQSISIMYFRPGIRWIPTYRAALSDKKPAENGSKKASIELQAELLNEAEDFEDVPVDIVVGVPNFRFRGTPSPLTLEATLRNALAEAAPDLMSNGGNSLSNAMYSQQVASVRQERANAGAQGTVNLPGELTAAGAQDLFVYNLPKLSLGKSDRIAVPIFTAETTYRDIYTWDVHAQKHDVAVAATDAGKNSPLTLSKNEVWHQITLSNATNLPWTTGAVMIMQGQQPLAQELLTYTAPKDEVRIPVTVSVDTRGSITEKETARDLRAMEWAGYNYARIERQMKLHLCNNKPVDIKAEITLRIGGKVTKASTDGDVTIGPYNASDWIQYTGHPAVNNSSTVVWKVTLKPGENFEPEVTYQHYARH
ncbi:DUF4139 domain-containing protein [Anatilimnocola floriformis]|uniref:DUF4139 domain-containing protein n=1 Tax=Anatilimnocola floriformis TaxID=2948575 RepID=UPI0020C27AAF|nr:DUF4139 domain-containing protein [Anatilimnocola floriformis]